MNEIEFDKFISLWPNASKEFENISSVLSKIYEHPPAFILKVYELNNYVFCAPTYDVLDLPIFVWTGKNDALGQWITVNDVLINKDDEKILVECLQTYFLSGGDISNRENDLCQTMKIDEEKTNECKKLTFFDPEYWEMSFNPFCLLNPRLSQTVIEALNNPIDHFGD